MSYEGLNYDEIRARAEKRARKRAEFLQHLAIYIVVNLFLWIGFFIFAMVIAHNPAVLLVPLLSTVGWGLAVAIHGAVYYFDTTGMDNMREREIQREIQREMQLRGLTNPDDLYAKPKREARQRSVRLSDDGELIYDDEPPRKASNRTS